jgi:hypothetical protein
MAEALASAIFAFLGDYFFDARHQIVGATPIAQDRNNR